MEFIQNLQQYTLFTKEQIFDCLHQAMTKQIAFTITSNHAQSKQINYIKAHLQKVNKNKHKFAALSQPIEALANMFEYYLKSLQAEYDRSKIKIDQLQSEVLIKIEKCQSAFLDIQRQIVNYGKEEMAKCDNNILQHNDSIQQNQKGIEQQKKRCFIKLLQFAQQQNQQNIKIKFMAEESESNMKKYGRMNSEMHHIFQDRIPVFEENILSQLHHINSIQKEKEELFEKVAVVFARAEEEKIALVQQFTNFFRPSYQPQLFTIQRLPYSANYKQIPKRGVVTSLKFFKTTVDLCLHPHPHNEIIIAHRQSLEASLNSQFQLESTNALNLNTSEISLQERQIKKYELFKIFLTDIREAYKQYQSENVIGFQQKFEQSMRNKGYRQLFIFFIYQTSKVSLKQKPLNFKQEQFLLKASNICLKKVISIIFKCLTCFDTQTAFRLILLSFHLKTSSILQFSKRIDVASFASNFDFWATNLIQNIFEYCEMMVIYYHDQMQDLLHPQSAKSQSDNFWGFLKPIQNLFKPNPQKTQIADPIKQFYHQIIKNVFTIEICLMKLVNVPKELQKKLAGHITATIQSLKFSAQIQNSLKKFLESLPTKNEEKLTQLIKNEMILERSLSKLFGVNQKQNKNQKKREMSLSQLINQWYKND